MTAGIRLEGRKIIMDSTSMIKTGGNPKKKSVNKGALEAIPANSSGSFSRLSEVTFRVSDFNLYPGFLVPRITLFTAATE